MRWTQHCSGADHSMDHRRQRHGPFREEKLARNCKRGRHHRREGVRGFGDHHLHEQAILVFLLHVSTLDARILRGGDAMPPAWGLLMTR